MAVGSIRSISNVNFGNSQTEQKRESRHVIPTALTCGSLAGIGAFLSLKVPVSKEKVLEMDEAKFNKTFAKVTEEQKADVLKIKTRNVEEEAVKEVETIMKRASRADRNANVISVDNYLQAANHKVPLKNRAHNLIPIVKKNKLPATQLEIFNAKVVQFNAEGDALLAAWRAAIESKQPAEVIAAAKHNYDEHYNNRQKFEFNRDSEIIASAAKEGKVGGKNKITKDNLLTELKKYFEKIRANDLENELEGLKKERPKIKSGANAVAWGIIIAVVTGLVAAIFNRPRKSRENLQAQVA